MLLSKHLDKGFWTLATNIFKAAYGLFFTLWLISVLPEEAWGAFYLIQITFLIISQLGLALAMQPYIKFFYESDDPVKLQSNALLLYSSFLILALLLILPLKEQFGKWLNIAEFETLIYFVPLLLFTSFMKLVANEIFKASHRLKEYFFSEALYFSANVVIMVSLYFHQGLFGPADVLLPMSISFALSSFFSLWLARNTLHWGFKFDYPLLKRMFSFGKYAFGSMSTSSIFQHADTYIVGLYLNPSAVGLLATVKVFGHGFQLYKQAMSLVAFPAFSRLFAEKRMQDLRAFYEKGIYYSNIVLVGMVAGLILLSGFLFDVVLQKYHEGIPVLKYFAITGLFVSWHVFGESVLYGVGKPKKSFYIRVLTGVINLLLNIVLIKYFGVWGAVTASLISLAILAGITTYFVRMEIDFTMTGIIKRSRDLVHFLRNFRGTKWNSKKPTL